MKLKVKFLKWYAGVPVAMLHRKTASKIGAQIRGRISIKPSENSKKEVLGIVDIVENKIVKEDEIVVSSEIEKQLSLKKGQKVDVHLAPIPKSLSFIKKKLNKKRLSSKEIEEIISDIVNNSLSESEIALFISAMYKYGMSMRETIYLIKAILKSGNKLNLNHKIVVDKHSIGGIPGNRTTPIVVSICAAAGLIFPKNSSRAITSAAGTADVIETIARVEFSVYELKKIIDKVGACMVWGGALGLVPADAKIIQIEKTLNMDPEAQLLASIISKKLAVESKYILIDIPCGENAKVSLKKAKKLKRKFEILGRFFRRKLKVVLTDGSQPIGNGIGPVQELKDILRVLNPRIRNNKNERIPLDLEEKSLFLAGTLLEMTGKAKKNKGIEMAKEILYSGKAFKKFKEIIKAQSGSLKRIKDAKFKKDILANKSGKVVEINNKKINSLARVAGCPTDKAAGLYLYHHLNEDVKKGEKILTIYAESKPRLKLALEFYKKQKPIKIK